MARILKDRELVNTRLANTYGGWIYCGGCSKTIGYLCYTTYNWLALRYQCKCGNEGSIRLAFEDETPSESATQKMVLNKNRLCCFADNSALVTVLSKNLLSYDFDIVCRACNAKYGEEHNE